MGSIKKNSLKIYFENITWLLIEKFVRLIFSLFVSVWLIRYLGPTKFGEYNYSISYVYLFGAIASLGLDGLVIKELVDNRYSSNSLLGTTFVLKFCGSILALCFIFFSLFFLDLDTELYKIILIVSINNFLQLFNSIELFFQSKVLSKYIVWSNVFSLLLSNLIKIVLIYFEFDFIYFVYAYLFDSIIIAFSYLFIYFKGGYNVLEWKFDFAIANYLIKNSWTLIISSLFVSIYFKIDLVLIEIYSSLKSVGYYSAAVKLSELWYFVPIIISNTVFPSLIKIRKINFSLFQEKLQSLFVFLIWLGILLSLFTTIFGDHIIQIIYGDKYNGIANVLITHIWTSIFVFYGVAWSNWMILENNQKTMMKIQVMSLITNLILNVVLIPKFGILGSALATLVSYAIGHLFFALFFKDQKLAIQMFWKSFNPFVFRNEIQKGIQSIKLFIS